MAITKIGTPELFDFSATNTALQLPTGDTASRPATPSTGEWRFNSQLKYVEYYDGGEWRQIDTESAAVFTPSENFNTNTYFGTGATQAIDAKFNEAANFNGSSSLIVTSSNFTGSTAAGSSISFWFKTSNTKYQNIFGNSTGFTSGSSISLGDAFGGITGESITFINEKSGSTEAFMTTDGAGAYADGVWRHAVFVSTSTTKAIYINGVSKTLTFFGGSASSDADLENIEFGSTKGSPSSSTFEGSLDQVRIFNTALTDAQAEDLYTDETTTTAATLDFPAGAGCIAAYQLDGNGNDIQSAQTATTVATYQLNGPTLVPSIPSNTYPGTPTNITYAAGKFDDAAVFNGSSSKITTSGKPMGSSDTLTISFWAKNITVTDYCSLFGEGGDSVLAGYRVLIKNTNDGNMSLSRSEGNNTYVFSDSYFYDFGTDGSEWVHCVMTASATQIKYYKNGVNELTQNVSNVSTATPGGNLLIGQDPQYSRFVGGNLDQIRIFNTTLPQAAVTVLYNETVATSSSASISYQAGTYDGTTTDIRYTGLQFQPDLTWIKVGDEENNNVLTDSVRGVDSILSSDGTNPTSTFDSNWRNQYGQIQSFDTNGFTIKNAPSGNADVFNKSGDEYISLNWKAGGTPTATNSAGAGNVPTAGSVKIDGVDLTTALAGTQAVKNISANTLAGFSIIKYQGTGSAGSIPHGLLDTPDFVIIKNLDGANKYWQVWAKGSGTVPASGIKRLYLNDQQGYDTSTSNVFYPDSTKINLNSGDGFFNSTDNFISYAFTSIPGYSFVGSYLGIGGTTGNVVNVGFEPSFILIKDSTNSGNWALINNKTAPTNPRNTWIRPNLSLAQFTNSVDSMNFSSTGFQVSGTATSDFINRSGATFIFLAIA